MRGLVGSIPAHLILFSDTANVHHTTLQGTGLSGSSKREVDGPVASVALELASWLRHLRSIHIAVLSDRRLV